MPLLRTGPQTQDLMIKDLKDERLAAIQIRFFRDQEFCMFDSKNNRMLDSVSFRLALIAAVFAVWSGAGYLLLSV
jgi:hypothetical protein